MDYIQVDIIGLSTSPSSGGAYALVLGEVDGNRRLPIIIGAFEAQAIALELEKIQPPRPLTHDLLRDLFDAIDADITDIVIDDLREGTFFAKIRYVYGGKENQLDARPSDAVALAVRSDAPIYVVPAVLEEAGIPAEDESATPLARATEEEEPREVTTARSPIERVQAQLDKAIESEDYERAAKLRDEIEQMKKEN
ncbi:MAG: bifunctional nuclease family protein [Rhodothermales bacterium]